VQTRRVLETPEEAVLSGEATRLRVVVARLGEIEVRLGVVDVACEAEAVLGADRVAGGVQLGREAVVAPSVEVVAGGGRAADVGEVDDRAQAVEDEVSPLS
jgi:hypothetical protein